MELELVLCIPPVVLVVVSTLLVEDELELALSTPVELGTVPGLKVGVGLARGGTLLLGAFLVRPARWTS